MTTEPTFEEMAQALSTVSMEVHTDGIQRRLTAAREMMTVVPVLDVVAVAFGAPAVGGSDSVESVIRAHDETWISGSRSEMMRAIAGVSVLGLLRQGETSTLTALACRSAMFLHYEPNVSEVISLADQALSDVTAKERARAQLAPLGASSKRLLAGQQELSGADAVATVRALARRLEEVVKFANVRLDRMDEEVNALWWARKRHPHGEAILWDEMPGLQRVARAAHEVTEYVHVAPATRGTVEVMNEVIGDVEQEPDVSLLAASEAIAASGGTGTSNGHHLLPFATLVHALRAYPEEMSVAESVVKQATGLVASQTVPLAGLGEQILREHSMLQVLA